MAEREINTRYEHRRTIYDLLANGNEIRNLYRFVSQNPHIDLREACQIILIRPTAGVCYSLQEWNEQGRRIKSGCHGIGYYDSDGNKRYVFDVADTYGKERYRRRIMPLNKILQGLDELNGTNQSESNRGAYNNIYFGVKTYLEGNENFYANEKKLRLYAEGIAYSLYSATAFPKDNGILLHGYPYSDKENALMLKEIFVWTDYVREEIDEAYLRKVNEIPVIDDTEDDFVSDEPMLPKSDKPPAAVEEKPTISPYYEEYSKLQKENPDCIVAYRLGDFYEIMGEKAEQAANILDLTLTGRNVGLPERVPMCGFPYRVADRYFLKIIESVSVVVAEPSAEPYILLSREEAGKNMDFPDLSPDESAEIDGIISEQEESDEPSEEDFKEAFESEEADETEEADGIQPDSADDAATVEPNADEESIENELAEEETDGEEFTDEADEEAEDYDVEESEKPKKASKPEKKGKPIWERKNRPSRQTSLFDSFDEQTPEDRLTEQILKGGSGVSGGKIRIYTEYKKNPYEKDFVRFLSREYGIGGRGGPDGIDEMHDGKGIRFSKTNIETKEIEIAVNLKWEKVAAKIADLIDEDNYLNEKERQEYATLVRFHEERQTAKDDNELIKVIARQIVEYGSAHTYCEKYSEYPSYLGNSMQFYTQHYEAVNEEIAKFDEVRAVGKGNIYPYSSPNILFKLPYCPIWQAVEERNRQRDEDVKEYVDRFTRQCADEYKSTYDKTVKFIVKADDLPEREYLFLKDNRDDFTKYFLKQKGVENVDISMQRIEITFDRKYIESLIAGNEQTPEERGKIRKIVNGIIAEGIKESTEGNYCSFFEDFKDDENFVREHKNDIVEELCRREEVSDVEMTDDGFDVNYYTQYLWNYKEEQEDTTFVSGLDAEEDEEWENRIESGEITPIGSTDEPTKEGNTDLTKIGFEQSELGGAKQRFKNNVEAIKLVNRLVNTQKEATDEERKVLAKYVGWGGLAQAFDEHNVAWQNEYKELKDVLSIEEYAAAKGSVLNAHYTSKTVIDGIYKALTRFGVKGNNRILEPAMGTGNFFGFMPQEIADGAKLYGVELDRVTGKIATKLYPQAKIQIKGFEETSFQDNSFDLMVTNVPFGGYTVFDPDYNKYNFYIHDYFIAKGIDKIKPNGLMAVITSKGTMDKQNPSIRKYIADSAELVGAVRLPNTAFKQTANTEVVTDILFCRKREERINATIENAEWLATGKTADGYEINNYYISHPEMILGTLVKETGLYGAEDITVKPDGRDLSEAINTAISRLPQDFYVNPEPTEEEETQKNHAIEVDYSVRQMNYKAENGKLYRRVGDEMKEEEIPHQPKDAYERIEKMIGLRTALREIIEIQTKNCDDETLAKAQEKLGKLYDGFVKKYGYINSSTNERLFREDGDSALLFACEEMTENRKSAKKADIFTKRTIRPYEAAVKTENCLDALQISKNDCGKADISYIEELTGKNYETVVSELGNTVFRNPETVDSNDKYSGFETAEEYLSGEVTEKLQTAERMQQTNPGLINYETNIAALRAAQPEKVKASEIGVRLGSSWVDVEYYKEFLCDLLGINNTYYRQILHINYNPFDSSWKVEKSNYYGGASVANVEQVYGTGRATAFRLFEDCLNQRSTQIYDTVEEDNREKQVLNQKETVKAREKQNKIKAAFQNWIFRDPVRRDDLEVTYNRLFNRIRLPMYDGSYLKFPGMNPEIELRPHQKNAVARISTGRNTLLHHVVGSGKTYTMIAAIETMRRLGTCKKAMIVVPNHLVEQWRNEYLKLYPSARILTTTKDDIDKKHRERFISKAAMGDWNAIIISQSAFAKINISKERQQEKIEEQIRQVEETIEYQINNFASRASIKGLERSKKMQEAALKKLLDDKGKDNVLTFEKLGVDYLFVDEADAYKNLFMFTKMNNVAGISKAASARASDMQLKTEYITELRGGDKGIVFATGTPISNSMAEMYIMQTYLQKRTLEKLGITFFDNWAADFGETVTALELSPSGQGYRTRTRFSKFTNLPELLKLYRTFADVQTSDMVKLDVPEAERRTITIKPTETIQMLTEEIALRAERIYAGGVDPHEDNMLKVTGDGKRLALDARTFDPNLPDERPNKLSVCAGYVYAEWKNSREIKGTQLVFCDLSTPKKAYEDYEYGKDFDAYNDLKYKLVEYGIPEKEIAYIHEANTDKQKQDLFNAINAGTVRVLIGSTEKCGAGTNVQERLVALHHLDAPYRPRDLIQRNGRGIRQGNRNKKIHIYTYATERTFDSYSYQILENKQRFISQIDRGDLTVREAADIDEATLSYAEIKAITSANPKIKRKMELETELGRLKILEGEYNTNLYSMQDKLRRSYPEKLARLRKQAENIQTDIKTVQTVYDPENFEINVLGVTYTDKKEGGRALMEALRSKPTGTTVAKYCGFKIRMNLMQNLLLNRSVTLSGAGEYEMEIGESESGNLIRLENFLKDFPKRQDVIESEIKRTEEDLAITEEQVKLPFEHAAAIEKIGEELSTINSELDLDRQDIVAMDDGDSRDEAAANEAEERQYKSLPPKRTKTRENKTMLTEELYKITPEAAEQNGVLPDYSVTQEQMHEYGYSWDGMLPVRIGMARVLSGAGVEVYRLGKNDTEGKVENGDFEDTESLYGVEKPAWEAFVNSEEGKAYLTAWHGVVESASKVVNEEMSYLDGAYADSLSNIFFEEREAIEKTLNGEFASSEEAKPYLKPLLERYYKRFPLDILFEYYGWNNNGVYSALAKNISDAELKKYAMDIRSEEAQKANENAEQTSKKDLTPKERVIARVAKEFEEYKNNLLRKSTEDVFYENYRIHVYTELCDVITESENLDDEYYLALDSAEGDLLADMYDDFITQEYASVNTYGDTVEFIENYCESYYNDILKAQEKAEEAKETATVGKFYGSTDDVAFYVFTRDLAQDIDTENFEEASEYAVVAPSCALTDEELKAKKITFLQNGQDVTIDVASDETTYASRLKMQMAYNRKFPVNETKINIRCKEEIERFIRRSFDGMHLRTENFADDVLKLFGAERVCYVLAATVKVSETDGRYSVSNKEWAKTIKTENTEEEMKTISVGSHPAIVDGLISYLRKHVLEQANENEIKENEEGMKKTYETETARGDKVLSIHKTESGRNIAVVQRKKDYVVAIGYDTDDGTWAQGRYDFLSEQDAEKYISGYTDDALVMQVSKEALIKSYERSSLFRIPETAQKYAGGTYFVYNNRYKEIEVKDFQNGSPDLCYEITFFKGEVTNGRDENGEDIEITAEELLELVDKTTDKDYTRNEAKEGEALRIKISEEALRGRYEKASLFSMPTDGNYAGFSYYLPNSRVEEDKENYGEMLTAVLKKDMKITLKDKTSGEEKEITAEELAVLVDGKGEEAYALPEIETDENSERESAFAKTERNLRENVPKEMLEQEKWVAVRTRYDREKGKLNKFLLNCKTGKAAESDNPETWTDFESACKYARANSGVALAYALDGKDKICCVDIDGCIDGNGNLSELSQDFLSKSGKTFAEYSVSGRGIHIWGKTDGADIRTFSKDGDFEFYQKSHFITMTGNMCRKGELENLDNKPIMREIKEKCERRTEWKGQGVGLAGISRMSDRDVVEKAMKSKGGENFTALYNGVDLKGNHSNSDMALMSRLSFWCNGDKEQMLRIFATSGLYRAEKSPEYYEYTATKAISTVYNRFHGNVSEKNRASNGKSAEHHAAASANDKE